MILSVIVPAYNEEKTIIKMLEKLFMVKFEEKIDLEVLVVNDGSKDNTLKLLTKFAETNKNIKVLNNPVNIGKSRTVKRGILESKGNFIVIQDADLEYDPKDINKLLQTCLKQNLNFVYGNRFGGSNKLIYKSFYIGNKGVTFISNIFTFPRFGKYIPDMEVCYKLINGEIARQIAKRLTATSNFGFEPEITAKLSRYKINGKHLKFEVLPITYLPRTIEEGKKIRWVDGLKALKEILKYNLLND